MTPHVGVGAQGVAEPSGGAVHGPVLRLRDGRTALVFSRLHVTPLPHIAALPDQLRYLSQGPVMARVKPGSCMFTKRTRPSAVNVGPQNSESLSWFRAIA